MSKNTGGTRDDRFLKQAASGWIAASLGLSICGWMGQKIVRAFLPKETKKRMDKEAAKKRKREREDSTEIVRMIKRIL